MEFSDIERTMMARCIELARRGAAEGEHPFGGVIANGAEVMRRTGRCATATNPDTPKSSPSR